MNEKRFNLLDLQKENLTPEEIEEIYDKPKNPEREFEGVDEDENNKEAVLEKSEDEKIEEAFLKSEDKKRRGESTEIENEIEDNKDDIKRQFKAGKKKIAEIKRGQTGEPLEKTEPETIESVQEPEVKNEKLETIREKTAGEGKELENLIKILEGIATTCKTLEDAKEGKIKTQNSEEGINNNIESLVNSVMKNRNTGEIEKIMNNSEMNDEQKDYIRKAIGKYGMEIGKGTEKASVETSIDDYFKNCKEDGIKLRIEEGGEKTFVIAGIPKKGNTIRLRNTIEAENVKTSNIKKEFLYELNNVKISKEDLNSLKETIEKNRSLFDGSGINIYAIEGTVNDLLKNNEDAEEIDISNDSAIIRAFEIVEKDEELRKEEAESRAKEEVKRKIGEAQRRAEAMKKITDEKIEEAESGKEVKDIEGSIKKQLRDIPNAKDFKRSLEEKEIEKKEEIRGVEVEEIPDIKNEEDVEAMSLEELNEEIKNMNNFLDKINREAEAREMDLSENDEYQKYNEYLDLLLKAKEKIEEVPEPIAVERAEVPESYIGIIRSFEKTERDMQDRKAALSPEDNELAVKFNLGEELTEEGVDGAMRAIRAERLGEVTAIDTAHARMAALIYGGDHNKAMRELTELKMKMDIQVATAQKRLFDAEGSLTIQELRGERRVAVDRFARAAREDVQREETPKKPNLFKRLWRKISPEKNIEGGAVENRSQGVQAREVPEEELNEKIKNARFEDLKEIANSVERQFPELKLKNSVTKDQIAAALKDLEDGNYEKVKRYSEKSIGLAQGIEGDISGKEELISFFERISDIAGEMERGGEETEEAVDVIEDSLPIEMTEEVNAEQGQLQEITKEMKRKIKESVKKSIEIEEFNISLIEGFMENYSNSENLFGEDIDEKLFDNIIKEKIGVKFEEIKDIKTKDFMTALREAYEEVKKGKENTTNDDRKSSEKDKKPEKIEEKNKDVDFKEAAVKTLHLGGGNHKEECVKIKKEIGVDDNKFSIFLKVMEDEIKNATSEDDLSSIYKNGFDIYASFGSNKHLLKMINTSKGYHFKKIRKETAEKIEKLSKTNKGLSDELLKKIHLFFDIDHFPSTEETIKELEKY